MKTGDGHSVDSIQNMYQRRQKGKSLGNKLLFTYTSGVGYFSIRISFIWVNINSMSTHYIKQGYDDIL